MSDVYFWGDYIPEDKRIDWFYGPHESIEACVAKAKSKELEIFGNILEDSLIRVFNVVPYVPSFSGMDFLEIFEMQLNERGSRLTGDLEEFEAAIDELRRHLDGVMQEYVKKSGCFDGLYELDECVGDFRYDIVE